MDASGADGLPRSASSTDSLELASITWVAPQLCKLPLTEEDGARLWCSAGTAADEQSGPAMQASERAAHAARALRFLARGVPL